MDKDPFYFVIKKNTEPFKLFHVILLNIFMLINLFIDFDLTLEIISYS